MIPNSVWNIHAQVVAATIPASTFLANLLPWWRFPVPMLAVVGSVALFVAVISALALLGPWGRRVTGPLAVVAGVTLPGEDPRVEQVRSALELATPQARATALAALGIGVVVTDTTAAGPAPEVAGRRFLEGDLVVVEVASPAELAPRTAWYVAMGAAWAAYVGCLVVAGWLAVARRTRSGTNRRKGGAAGPR